MPAFLTVAGKSYWKFFSHSFAFPIESKINCKGMQYIFSILHYNENFV